MVGNRCFIYNRETRDYNSSVSYCKTIGGTIASIHDEEENKAMLDLFPYREKAQVYIGAELEHGEWKWNDGSPWWAPAKQGDISGIYNESRIAVNCPHCDNDGLWHDWGFGGAKFGVICALKLSNAIKIYLSFIPEEQSQPS